MNATTTEPQVCDLTVTAYGWAFEWGTFTASYVVAPASEEKLIRANLVRIFKRTGPGKVFLGCGVLLTE